ncbi:MAG: hypothetical protein K2O99_08300, partial [Lachnospiraceae bacterium]|nr:hypothetical protein [Lachnospiraceae bacterium]
YFGAVTGETASSRDIVKMAADIMEPRDEGSYAKGIRAYDAWKEMLLDEKWFENNAGFDDLFAKFIVQNDAMDSLHDGRRWGAAFFEQMMETCGEAERQLCADIAKSFHKVSRAAEEMMAQAGDWSDVEQMLKRFASRAVREQLAGLIDAAKAEDEKALAQIRQLVQQ